MNRGIVLKTTERNGPWIILRARLTGPFVKMARSPNTVHPTLAGAFQEAVRLAGEDQEGTFSVFECIGQVIGEKQLEYSSVVAESPIVRDETAKKILARKPKKVKSTA